MRFATYDVRLRKSHIVNRKSSSVLVLHDAFRHHALLGRHAHEVGALGVTAQVEAGRVVVHTHRVQKLAVGIIHLHILHSPFSILNLNEACGRVREDRHAVVQDVVVNTRCCEGDGGRRIARHTVGAMSNHLHFVGGLRGETRQRVRVAGGAHRVPGVGASNSIDFCISISLPI